jgi:hypothetical protein
MAAQAGMLPHGPEEKNFNPKTKGFCTLVRLWQFEE